MAPILPGAVAEVVVNRALIAYEIGIRGVEEVVCGVEIIILHNEGKLKAILLGPLYPTADALHKIKVRCLGLVVDEE